MENIKTKAKIFAILVVSFVVFAMTLFALAENKNGNSLFLDSDQDGLTDQEEQMVGTNPVKADTDSDGYSDGKEIESGYNPLKPAPGDKIAGTQVSGLIGEEKNATDADGETFDPLGQLLQNDALTADMINDLTSDPNNPNLTNEMIGQLMQLTKEKAGSSDTFAENPTFSADDLTQISQNALETVDLTKDLPDIKDSELNILPPVDEKLSEEKIKSKQKEEIEKYLAQSAFILASNAPFSIEEPTKLESQIASESTNFFSALASGDKTKINSYATKARAGIDQLKKVPTPFILKDIQKSMIQIAIYTLDQKENVSLNTSDPMKSLAAVSSLQAVAQNAMGIQEQLSQILEEYEIAEVSFP